MKAGRFEKVTLEQFEHDWLKQFPKDQERVKEIYDGIALPKRATKGSAGYDFIIPRDLVLGPKETVLIPTGIRAKIEDGYVLMLFPRSSLGFRYRMQLDNTAGIIDADYYEADNQGHIMCKITNDSQTDKVMELKAGQGFVQGIFLQFGTTEDDDVQTQRTGGFGSTDGK